MKKITLLFFITIIGFSSCSEANENEMPINEGSGYGSWPKFMGDNGNSGFSDSNISMSTPNFTLIGDSKPYHYPVYSDGTLIVASSGISSYTSKLHSIDVDSGIENWNENYSPSDGVPTISNNTIFISGSYGEDVEFYSSNYLYAIDINSGSVKWKYNIDNSNSNSALVSDEQIIFTTRTGSIYAFDFDSGQVMWNINLEYAYNMNSPSVANNLVYIGYNKYNSSTYTYTYSVIAFDLNTGVEKWETNVDGDIFSALTVAQGKVIVHEYGGDRDGHLHALSATTGDEIWSFNIGRYSEGTPAIGYDKVFMISENQILYALNINTGQILWDITRVDIHDWKTTIAISNGMILVGGCDYLYAFDAETGAEKWKVESECSEGPIVAGGKVIIESSFEGFKVFE